MENQTVISEVFLVGFPGVPEDLHNLVAAVMFLVYVFSLTANGSVICLVTLNMYLHQPMYLIIANLAASNLLFDTVTLPKLIARYWFGSSSINFKVCIFQMFCVHFFGSIDSYLLMLMAVDRYIAISQPLRYTLVITNKRTLVTCSFFWILAASSRSATVSTQFSKIVLCGPDPNKINTLFCTHGAIMDMYMDCTDVTSMRNESFVSAMVVLLVCLGIIVLSYILIIVEIATSYRSDIWRKAFYTCTTHLLVVALYFVPRLFLYIVSNISSISAIIVQPDINALLLFFYSVVPHLANPVIYFLRTKEIRQTFAKVLQRIKYRVGHM
ncbi:olfactory receptor 10G4-like [Hyla sarda]|uniref:olfactory receptor 10G4-like n=1 Tax=Hyla sarda TaxID=327740 RepID=UPI0024C45F13|nr:olfactory receptor 10G4-like [Hyla sarda]